MFQLSDSVNEGLSRASSSSSSQGVHTDRTQPSETVSQQNCSDVQIWISDFRNPFSVRNPKTKRVRNPKDAKYELWTPVNCYIFIYKVQEIKKNTEDCWTVFCSRIHSHIAHRNSRVPSDLPSCREPAEQSVVGHCGHLGWKRKRVWEDAEKQGFDKRQGNSRVSILMVEGGKRWGGEG